MALTAAAFLAAASRLPALPHADFASLAPLVVLTPHPDDESLACGGLIALLRARALPVRVVAVSDGGASHPGSRAFPRERLAALRAGELRAAVAELGLEPGALSFLGLPDGKVPRRCQAGFDEALRLLLERLGDALPPRTLLTSWRHDPHADHVATYELARAWQERLRPRPRLLEYIVWGWQMPSDAVIPGPAPAGFTVETRSVVELKRRAIERHGSQLGRVITDDPSGFRLESAMVAGCVERPELFLDLPP